MRFSLTAVAVFSVAMLTAPGVVLGQEAEEPPEAVELEEFVVTATRRKIPIAEAPRSVTVVGEEDVEASAAEKLDDILRNVPGVMVESHHGLDSPPRRTVSLRGVGPEQVRTLVLLDGVPLNSMYNGWVEWSRVPKDDVEQIEIVRGPASSLYGSSALGGVINIITRRPEKPSETVAQFGYGSMNTWNPRIAQSGRRGSFSYSLSAGFETTDGYIAEKTPQPYNIKRDREEADLRAKFIWDLDGTSSLTLGLGGHQATRGHGREFFRLIDCDSFDAHAKYRRDFGGKDFEATLFFTHQLWEAWFDSPMDGYTSKVREEEIAFPNYGAILHSNIKLGGSNTMTIGGDFRHGEVESVPTFLAGPPRSAGSEGKQDHFSIFVQDEFRSPDERLLLTFGGRVDHVTAYDGSAFDDDGPGPIVDYDNDYARERWTSFNPQVSMAYHLNDDTKLRASIGRGFRAPSLYDLYTTVARGPNLYQSNPNLGPESLVSYEVGVDHHFSPGLLGRATLYHSDAADYIGRVNIVGTTYQYQNVSEVDMNGIELELKYRISDFWSCNASYTYNSSKIDSFITNPALEGNDLPYTPNHTATAGAVFSDPGRFNLSMSANIVGDRYSDETNSAAGEFSSYMTFDMKIWKTLGKSTYSLGVENLFDVEYEPIAAAGEVLVAPGRVVNASVKVTF